MMSKTQACGFLLTLAMVVSVSAQDDPVGTWELDEEDEDGTIQTRLILSADGAARMDANVELSEESLSDDEEDGAPVFPGGLLKRLWPGKSRVGR